MVDYDLFVIGGGVNGCAIARDAAGRGLSVFLCEQGDLASATSSASTKLIHGGLRYLEQFEFRLVREALIEREVLLKAAPHIVRPLRFVLPHLDGMRPRVLIRAGLFLYDHLGGRRLLPGTRTLDLSSGVIGAPLKPGIALGYEYSDCWVDDARLVVLNARDASRRGATIAPHTRCLSARRDGGHWTIEIESERAKETVRAKALVNAAGPWVSTVLANVVGDNTPQRIRMVKGSHIVVDKLYEHDRAYIFQNNDGRICFTIPYEEKFTLVGTTDEDYFGDPGQASISTSETDYLLRSVNRYFRKIVSEENIRWTYSGVRPLFDDGSSKAQEATRDYVLKLKGAHAEAPLLSVFGGKITTARRLAETAMKSLSLYFPKLGPPWTAAASLPGGDLNVANVEAYVRELEADFPFVPPNELLRMFRAYGTDTRTMLGASRSPTDLGERFGYLSAREVDYLCENEWASTPEDILWRRSKVGLHIAQPEIARLQAHLDRRAASEAPT